MRVAISTAPAPTKAKYSVTFRVLRGDPASETVAAEDAGSATQVRMIRTDVDPLLGLVTITLLPR